MSGVNRRDSQIADLDKRVAWCSFSQTVGPRHSSWRSATLYGPQQRSAPTPLPARNSISGTNPTLVDWTETGIDATVWPLSAAVRLASPSGTDSGKRASIWSCPVCKIGTATAGRRMVESESRRDPVEPGTGCRHRTVPQAPNLQARRWPHFGSPQAARTRSLQRGQTQRRSSA